MTPYPFSSATPPPKWLNSKRPFLAQFITTGNRGAPRSFKDETAFTYSRIYGDFLYMNGRHVKMVYGYDLIDDNGISVINRKSPFLESEKNDIQFSLPFNQNRKKADFLPNPWLLNLSSTEIRLKLPSQAHNISKAKQIVLLPVFAVESAILNGRPFPVRYVTDILSDNELDVTGIYKDPMNRAIHKIMIQK
jgi:hypothetical protein